MRRFGIKWTSVAVAACVGFGPAWAGDRIEPSGDTWGVSDRDNLQEAFDLAGTDPGAVIELDAGTYYLRGGVAAEGFIGKLEGSGSADTTLVVLGEGTADTRHSVLHFSGGDPKIEALSIVAAEGSRYVDTEPGNSYISDGGAFIDVVGGAATIEDVVLDAQGSDRWVENGVVATSCTGAFTLSDSSIRGTPGAGFVFDPKQPSRCDITIEGNTFEHSGDGVSLFGYRPAPEPLGWYGNDGQAVVEGNSFFDTRSVDVLARWASYPVRIEGNVLLEARTGAFGGILVRQGDGHVEVLGNVSTGSYQLPNIYLAEQLGSALVEDNTVTGGSWIAHGLIGVTASDDVVIRGSDVSASTWISEGFLPPLGWVKQTQGAHPITNSTNVRIFDTKLPPGTQDTCQLVLVGDHNVDVEVGPGIPTCSSPFPTF